MRANAAERGAQLMTGLAELQKEFKSFADLRGLGLMIGCEFRTAAGEPDKELTKALQKYCIEHGLLLLTCGPWDDTLRLIPPINVKKEEVDEALQIFGAALDAVGK